MNSRARAVLVLVGALALVACSKPPPPSPQQREFAVGAHRVSVLVPVGWTAAVTEQGVALKAPPPTDEEQRKLDYAGQLSWVSLAEVTMRDLGPASSTTTTDFVDQTMQALGRDKRREVASRTSMTIDGIAAEEVKTWDRLTHNAPEHRLFIVNDGNLFTMTHALAGREPSVAAYAAVRASLKFVREAGTPRLAR